MPDIFDDVLNADQQPAKDAFDEVLDLDASSGTEIDSNPPPPTLAGALNPMAPRSGVTSLPTPKPGMVDAIKQAAPAARGLDPRIAGLRAVGQTMQRVQGSPDRSIAGEAAAGAGRGLVRAPASVLGGIAAAGSVVAPETFQPVAEAAMVGNEALAQLGQTTMGPSDAPGDPMSARKLAGKIGEGAPAMAAAAGLAAASGATGNAAAAIFAGTMAADTVGQVFNDAMTEHGDPARASHEAVAVGMTTMATQMFPGMAVMAKTPVGRGLIGRVAQNTMGRFAIAGGAQGLAGGVQAYGNQLATEMMRHDRDLTVHDALMILTDPDLAQQYMEAAIAQGVLGSVMHAPFEASVHGGTVKAAARGAMSGLRDRFGRENVRRSSVEEGGIVDQGADPGEGPAPAAAAPKPPDLLPPGDGVDMEQVTQEVGQAIANRNPKTRARSVVRSVAEFYGGSVPPEVVPMLRAHLRNELGISKGMADRLVPMPAGADQPKALPAGQEPATVDLNDATPKVASDVTPSDAGTPDVPARSDTPEQVAPRRIPPTLGQRLNIQVADAPEVVDSLADALKGGWSFRSFGMEKTDYQTAAEFARVLTVKDPERRYAVVKAQDGRFMVATREKPGTYKSPDAPPEPPPAPLPAKPRRPLPPPAPLSKEPDREEQAPAPTVPQEQQPAAPEAQPSADGQAPFEGDAPQGQVLTTTDEQRASRTAAVTAQLDRLDKLKRTTRDGLPARVLDQMAAATHDAMLKIMAVFDEAADQDERNTLEELVRRRSEAVDKPKVAEPESLPGGGDQQPGGQEREGPEDVVGGGQKIAGDVHGPSVDPSAVESSNDLHIHEALMQTEGRDEKIAGMREHGADDAEILSFINRQFGISGSRPGANGVRLEMKGGKVPRLKIVRGSDDPGATIAGPKLVKAVRRMYGIPQPGERPPGIPSAEGATDGDAVSTGAEQAGGDAVGGEPVLPAGAGRPGLDQPEAPQQPDGDQLAGGVAEGQDQPVRTGTGPRSGSGSRRGGGKRSGGADPEPGDPDRPAGNGGAPAGPEQPDATAPGSAPRPQSDVPDGPRNHVIRASDTIVPKGRASKIRANLDAIRLLQSLEAEDRLPSKDEAAVLVQYTGWGALKPMFDRAKIQRLEDARNRGWSVDQETQRWADDWGEHALTLKAMIGEKEWDRAAASVLNAHYTSEEVIRGGLWAIAKHLGVKGGRFLENSAGIGHVIGMMPREMDAQWAAVDIDNLSARFLRKLYPAAAVYNMGFQDAPIENGTQDLVIGNVPFSSVTIPDGRYPTFSLHNYMIARSIDTLKPGGIAVLITSNSTMDNAASTGFRKWAAQRADLVGAIRLPNDAFMENAGTAVTTDILIFRKRGGTAYPGLPWLDAVKVPAQNLAPKGKDGEDLPTSIPVNEFFAAHPELMLGKWGYSGTMYRADSPALAPHENRDLGVQLKEAIKRLPKNIAGDYDPAALQQQLEQAGEGMKEDSFQLDDKGRVRVVQKGMLADPWWIGEKGEDRRERVAKSLMLVRDKVKEIIADQRNPDLTDDQVERARRALRATYEDHVKKHGRVTDRYARATLGDDPEFGLFDALETVKTTLVTKTRKSGKNKGQQYQDVEREIIPADILTKRTQWPSQEPTSAETVEDAVSISLSWRGGLNESFVSKLTGRTIEQVRSALTAKGMAFIEPGTGELVHKDDYLSGNVKAKLAGARTAAEINPQFAANVTALEAVQPAPVPASRISVKLGAPWVPGQVVRDWIKSMLDADPGEISYSETAGSWVFDWSHAANVSVANQQTHAGGGLPFLRMVADTLNQKLSVVIEEYTDENGNDQTRQNPELTQAAREKQQEHRAAFELWAKQSEHAASLTDIYNERFNTSVQRVWTPNMPESGVFPNQSPTYLKPREHQVTGVARAVRESMILGDEVGTGKTLTFVMTAMEWRRLGLARKPCIVVQNSTTQQIARAFRNAYPNAKILVPSPTDFDAERRQRTMARIATGDWDAVILPQSQFDRVADNPETVGAWHQEQRQELIEALMEETAGQWKEGGKRKSRDPKVRVLEEALARLDNAVQSILDRETDNVLFWDQMGIDGLIVDEAHAYKKVFFQTRMERVRGLDTQASQRGIGLLMKVRDVQKRVGEARGVVLSTGTPITNTLAEAWNFMRVVRPDLVREYGISKFDQFQQTFTEARTELTMDATGRFKSLTYLSKFDNLAQLQQLWMRCARVTRADDIISAQQKAGKVDFERPEMVGGGPTLRELKPSPQLEAFLKRILDEYEAYEDMEPKDRAKNSHIPLVLTGLAKKAAVDLRLAVPTAEFDPQSKTAEVLNTIVKFYHEQGDNKGVQAVFSDRMSSPTHRTEFAGLDENGEPIERRIALPPDQVFNLFNDMTERLVRMGIPREEIAVMPGAPANQKQAALRDALMERIRSGEVRVVFGTTARMGVGVNIQDRLYAEHHMDAPDTPADIEQRDGRMIRQGNKYAEWGIPVHNIRYGIVPSFDAGAFARLARKQGFIAQIISGKIVGDSAEDVEGSAAVTYAEFSATLSGDPRHRERFEVQQEVRRLESLRNAHINQQADLVRQVETANASIAKIRDENTRSAEEIRVLTQVVDPKAEITIGIINKKAAADLDEGIDALDQAVKDQIAEVERDFASDSTLTERMKDRVFRSVGKSFTVGPVSGTIKGEAQTALDGSMADQPDARFEASVKVGKHTLFLHSWYESGLRSGRGLYNRLISKANGYIEQAKNRDAIIASMERKRDQMKALMGKPFEHTERLRTTQARLEELNNQLRDEDDARNAARAQRRAGGAVGFLPPGHEALDAILDAGKRLSEGVRELFSSAHGWFGEAAGHTMPRTTRANRAAGEAGARYLSSAIAGPHIADALLDRVVPPGALRNRMERTVGAVLTEDRLRGIRAKLEAAGNTDAAKEVASIVGPKGFFANEREYLRTLKDPVVIAAVDRYKRQVLPVLEDLFRNAQGLDPGDDMPEAAGEHFGLYSHLFAVHEEEGAKATGRTYGGGGNLRNVLTKKSPLARRAWGNAREYSVSLRDIITAPVVKQLEIANQRAFYQSLIDAGLAQIGHPGEKVVLGGKPTKAETVKYQRLLRIIEGTDDEGEPTAKVSASAKDRVLYVRMDIYPEFRRAVNVDTNDPGLVGRIASIFNTAALVGPVDAITHAGNLLSAAVLKPGVGGNLFNEAIMATGGPQNLVIALAKITAGVVKVIRKSPETKERMADLAKIGAMRDGGMPVAEGGKAKSIAGKILNLSPIIETLDPAVRLVLDDAYQYLAKMGVLENSETARREFVNSVGQYNKRAQSWFRATMRNWGVSPFITAGTTFRNLGLETMAGRVGAPVAGGSGGRRFVNRQALRGAIWGRLLGTVLSAALLSLLIGEHKKHKDAKFGGRSGVPFGAVDTYTDDDAGRPVYFDLLEAMGMRRALRSVGIDAAVKAFANGLSPAAALDAAIKQAANSSVVYPLSGPLVRAGVTAMTGHDVSGYRTVPVQGPGRSQFAANARGAAVASNQFARAAFGDDTADQQGVAAQFIPKYLLKSGKSDKAVQTMGKRVDMARLGDFADDLFGRARRAHPVLERRPAESPDEFGRRVRERADAIKAMVEEEVKQIDPALQGRARVLMYAKKMVLANR